MSETLTTALTTAMTAIKTDAISVLGTIVPLAIGVGGLVFVIRKAMSWFKSLAK